MVKKGLLVLAVVMFSVGFLIGCMSATEKGGGQVANSGGSSYAGVYMMEGNPDYYMILREDWTYMEASPGGYADKVSAEVGGWGVGDNIILMVPSRLEGGYFSYGYEYQIAGNKLISPGGKSYVKK